MLILLWGHRQGCLDRGRLQDSQREQDPRGRYYRRKFCRAEEKQPRTIWYLCRRTRQVNRQTGMPHMNLAILSYEGSGVRVNRVCYKLFNAFT